MDYRLFNDANGTDMFGTRAADLLNRPHDATTVAGRELEWLLPHAHHLFQHQ